MSSPLTSARKCGQFMAASRCENSIRLGAAEPSISVDFGSTFNVNSHSGHHLTGLTCFTALSCSI